MNSAISSVPLPDWHRSSVVVAPPEKEAGAWAGAPSAVRVDGSFFLAYRLRLPIGEGRGVANVVAQSSDGISFRTLAVVTKDMFGAESIERPALVVTPEGRWRLYVSCATPGTKHWRVDVLEADRPEDLPGARPVTVLPGDRSTGVKDPVVLRAGNRWHLWASRHPLEVPEHADRMTTGYATSDDGLHWTWRGTALQGRPGRWDARGARLTAVFLDSRTPVAYYDGRASAEENWEERTGISTSTAPGIPPGSMGSPIGGSAGSSTAGMVADIAAQAQFGRFQAEGDTPPVSSPHGAGGLRYLSVLPVGAGAYRLYYEATRADGAHDLRTQLWAHPDGVSGRG